MQWWTHLRRLYAFLPDSSTTCNGKYRVVTVLARAVRARAVRFHPLYSQCQHDWASVCACQPLICVYREHRADARLLNVYASSQFMGCCRSNRSSDLTDRPCAPNTCNGGPICVAPTSLPDSSITLAMVTPV
jgi:hypothetical protein